MSKRKCLIGGNLGIVIRQYRYTIDVYICKTRRISYGVHRNYIKLLPKDDIVGLKTDPNQLKLSL